MARPTVYLSEAQDAPSLVGPAEVAAILGVGPSRVTALRQTDDFPPPALRLRGGWLWWREDVEAWAETNAERRERHRKKESA